MDSISRPLDLKRVGRIALVSLLGLFIAAFSKPIEDLRQEIRTLKMEQATIAQREERLMVRQDELARTIKRLKSEPRTQIGPFGSRKLETALQQLRAVLDESESLQRQRIELGVLIDEALTRLRTAVRDEILRLVSRNTGSPDPRDLEDIHALLTLYPQSLTLPAMPAETEPLAPFVSTTPETLTEQTLLLRDQRERHEVVLRRAEVAHSLLSEELTLYDALAEHDQGFDAHRLTVIRQVAETNSLIQALNERMSRMDERLRQLDVLTSQPMTVP